MYIVHNIIMNLVLVYILCTLGCDVPSPLDRGARDLEGVGGADDDLGGVLEQAGRQRRRTQLLGRAEGRVECFFFILKQSFQTLKDVYFMIKNVFSVSL